MYDTVIMKELYRDYDARSNKFNYFLSQIVDVAQMESEVSSWHQVHDKI